MNLKKLKQYMKDNPYLTGKDYLNLLEQTVITNKDGTITYKVNGKTPS